MSQYQVKNWRQFQHYSDRNPPWIKLHFSILSSQDWVDLDDASRVLAIACMLIASRNDGAVDGSEAGLRYLKRVAYLHKTPNLNPLIECGFLELASNLLAGASAVCQNARPETETQLPTETPCAKKNTKPIPEGFSAFWQAWPKSARKVGKAACLKRWKANNLEPLAGEIIAHVEAMKPTEQWRKGYDPAPSRYLNERRWEDGMPDSGPAVRKLAL